MSRSEKVARDDIARLTGRINDIEVKLEYLQRDYESQNEMLLADASRIRKLEETVKRLTETVEKLSSSSELSSNLADEKPPHY